MNILKKYALSLVLFAIFFLCGTVVAAYRHKAAYLLLFCSMGAGAAGAEWLAVFFPGKRQLIRRLLHAMIGGGLFIGLSLIGRVNFQFVQITFDFMAGVVTGALIQFIFARVFLAFFIGSSFCSRACWSGAMFELLQNRVPASRQPAPRRRGIALAFLLFLIALAAGISIFVNPALDDSLRRTFIIADNGIIILTGFVLTVFLGSRAWCRLLCPFITVSGLLARYSIFKITPVAAQRCTSCGSCNRACPMLIDVRAFVRSGKRLNHESCTVCERCVSACPEKCLLFAPGKPW